MSNKVSVETLDELRTLPPGADPVWVEETECYWTWQPNEPDSDDEYCIKGIFEFWLKEDEQRRKR